MYILDSMNNRNIMKLVLMLFLVVAGCAKIQSPPGGPIDKTPPKIIETTPSDMEKSVDVDAIITIEFSEGIVKDPECFVVQPTLENMKINFRGRKVLIKHSPFEEKATYVVSVLPTLTDLRKNMMGETQSFAFSTGESIDSGLISGYVYESRTYTPVTDAIIEAYDDISFNDVIRSTWSGDDGSFTLNYLPKGEYYLLAKVLKGDGILIKIGVSRNRMPTMSKGIMISLTDVDTIPPKITLIEMRDNSTLKISFDSKPQLNKVNASVESCKLTNVWLAPKDSSTVFMRFESLPDTFDIDIVFCDFNNNCDSISRSIFNLADLDTASPELKNSKKRITINSREVYLIFDEPFNAVFETCKNYFKVEKTQSNILKLIVDPKIPVSDVETLVLDSLCDEFENCKIESLTVTYPNRTLGQLWVRTPKFCESEIMLAKSIDKIETYNLLDRENLYWAFIPEGRYLLFRFCDEDNNSYPSSGNIDPFERSEKFEIYKDTIYVRGGWETEVIW